MDIALPPPSPGLLPGVTMAGFRQRDAEAAGITMVAHPAVTVLVDLSGGRAGDDRGIVYDAHGRRTRGSVVVGLLPGELRAAGRGVDCLQIRLDPVAAAALLGPEPGGPVAALEAVWGRDAGRLEDRLRAASCWEERFAVAADWLERRRAERPRVDPEVAHVWRRTLGSRGRARVEALADEVGWSRQLLWARFRAQLGVTPKRAARLVRFDHAVHLLAVGREAAGVAAESGFADQSHLHREVRTFTGLTPAAVAAAPWLAVDATAWPGSVPAPTRGSR
ncbi:AraC family transcriptional regulator [Kitasatospora sp. CB01950]|nr:AraC family transcriptional regulator [Kitasatospora sp. CB01950]